MKVVTHDDRCKQFIVATAYLEHAGRLTQHVRRLKLIRFMRLRARLLLTYVLFWLIFFESSRVLFLAYEWRHASSVGFRLLASTFFHGFPMDVSAACAVALIPVCLVARDGFVPSSLTRRLLVGYTLISLLLAALAVVADLEMFRVWGFRIDSTALRYLASPSEAFASALGSPLILLIGIFLAVLGAAIGGFWLAVLPLIEHLPLVTRRESFLLLGILLPAFAIIAQGGFRWRIPLAPGSVFFSRDPFANSAAVNPVWNLFESLTHFSDEGSVETFASPAFANRIIDSLLLRSSMSEGIPRTKLLAKRPSRIVLLFWEGFTAKIAEPLGGLNGVTPGFTRLAKEGILFDSLYASGSRTTNGMVAVLSGLPSHPRTSPLNSAARSAALPSLSAALSAAGYRTGFYYGGSLEFDNRNRYLLSSGYDEVVDKKSFDAKFYGSRWGVQDPYTLNRLFGAFESGSKPLFAVTLTLSSHEPFGVPGQVRIAGNDSEHRFLNAQAFTDAAVYRFIERLKATSQWDSTLVIIVADHGSPYPFRGTAFARAPEQYRIPMLWLGGALAMRDTVIHHTLAQFDIPKILLAQLGLPSEQFVWSKDIFAPSATSFGYYSFPNGFGFVDGTGSYVFDNGARSIVQKSGHPAVAAVQAGRALQQAVTQQYIDLSKRHHN